MKFKVKFLSVIVIVFVVTTIFSFHFKSNITAQSPVLGMIVSPPTFELSANPGGELVNSIKVTNTSSDPLTLKTATRNFTALGEEGSVVLDTNEASSYSLASWVFIDPAEVMIDPGETRIFNFQIKIPLNAEPGGHFGSVVFIAGNEAGPDAKSTAVAQEVATLVLLKIAGDITESATLESFKTEKSFYEYGPVKFETRLRNSGNVHIKPSGFISVTNIFGKQVAKIDANTKNILPNAIRRYEDEWSEQFLIGKYTATTVLNYANGNKTITGSTSFTVFPYKIGGLILFILIIIGVSVYLLRKRLALALKVLLTKE